MNQNFFGFKRICLILLVLFIIVASVFFILRNCKIRAENEKFVALLKVYSAYDKNGSITFKRFGKDYDGGYVVPLNAMGSSDVLMG